jgi:hypothetical protein
LDWHWTHVIVVMSQYGVGAPHWLLFAHARTHRWLPLQAKPASPQFVLVRHCTHAPVVV